MSVFDTMPLGKLAKPCPFCGCSNVSMVGEFDEESSTPKFIKIECPVCGASTQKTPAQEDEYGSVRAKWLALARWNERTFGDD